MSMNNSNHSKILSSSTLSSQPKIDGKSITSNSLNLSSNSAANSNSNPNVHPIDEYFQNDIRVFFWPKEKFSNYGIPNMNMNKYFYFMKGNNININNTSSSQSHLQMNIEVKLLQVERNQKRTIDLTNNNQVTVLRSFLMTHQDYLMLPNLVNQEAKMLAEQEEKIHFFNQYCNSQIQEDRIRQFLNEYTPNFMADLYTPGIQKQKRKIEEQTLSSSNSKIVSNSVNMNHIDYVACFNIQQLVERSIPSLKEHLYGFYKLYPKLINEPDFKDRYLRSHNFYAIYPILYEFSELIRNSDSAADDILKLNSKYNMYLLIFFTSLIQSQTPVPVQVQSMVNQMR